MAERGSKATLHPIHGAQDLESTVAQGFVKHGYNQPIKQMIIPTTFRCVALLPLTTLHCLASWPVSQDGQPN